MTHSLHPVSRFILKALLLGTLLRQAGQLGLDTQKLIWVGQTRNDG